MSVQHYHNLCQRYKGKAVEIRTHRGEVHRGVIRHVDRRRVYLEPLGGRRDLGGFGLGFYGPAGDMVLDIVQDLGTDSLWVQSVHWPYYLSSFGEEITYLVYFYVIAVEDLDSYLIA
ncbi:hypothetical protein [Virgibacillus halodenitrificans]|uniref:hypothetical protein n=1 Tax=Virgibacillus halodenitrificans TaxID=1482 RepID=UPI000A7B042E